MKVPGVSPPVLKRLAAYACDCAILAAVLMPVHFLAMGAIMEGARPEWSKSGPLLWLFVLATYSLPVWFYFIWMESKPAGQTIAKRWFGIQVVTRHGGPVPRKAIILRTAVKLLPWEILHATLMLPVPAFDAAHEDLVTRPGMTIQFFLVASWLVTVLVTQGNRAVHDFLAGTFVITKGTARDPELDSDDATE